MPARFAFLFSSAATALAMSFVLPATAAQPLDDYYKGKQFKIIVDSDPGGTYDAYARILAKWWPEHLPGKPGVIIQNMPGQGGLKAMNFLAALAPKDGTVVSAAHGSAATAPLLSPEVAQYDAAKMNWIGNVTGDPFIGYVWHTVPVYTINDLKTRETVAGGTAVGAAGVDYAIFAKELLDFKIKLITGYKAATQAKIAMERGEVEMTFANGLTSLRTTAPDWVRDNKVRIVVQHGLKRHPDLPEVPLLIDQAKNQADHQVLELLLGRQEFSKPYLAPPDMPAEIVTMLRRSFDATLKDPGFLADAEKAQLPVDGPMTGEELAKIVGGMASTPPAVVKRFNDIYTNFQASK